jgi:AcrR family transcriptional regulator
LLDASPKKPPGRTGQRGAYVNGEKKRGELVDAAFEVFAKWGFQRLSVRQIAEEIGTSHTALLHHFGSKDALLEAVLIRREAIDGSHLRALIDERGILDGLPEYMKYNAQRRNAIQLEVILRAEAVRPDHPAHVFVRRRDQAFYDAVMRELQDEQIAGRLKPGLDLSIVARQITSTVEGNERQWLYDDSIDMSAQLRALMNLIRRPEANAQDQTHKPSA